MHSGIETKFVRATRANVSDDALTVWLDDGRAITTPLAWYPRLIHASEQERNHFQIIGHGEGLHWPDLDEDLSIASMLAGQPSAEGAESLARWLTARDRAS